MGAIDSSPSTSASRLPPSSLGPGGLFEDNRRVFLNHRPQEAKPHKDHQPKGLTIRSNPQAHGEDDPLFSKRLSRDGWEVRDEWQTEILEYPEFYKTIQPERRGPNLTGADWVDWDRGGRLLVLRAGRASVAEVRDGQVGELRELVDLTADRPERRIAPDWARRW